VPCWADFITTTPVFKFSVHTGILARAEQGYEVDQIANDIGMSRQNVDHYMRLRDQMKVGADGQKRLRLIGKED
jgi:predicted transcriptional regulator